MRYEINGELGEIEIYFESCPRLAIREELKIKGFRWNPQKMCWYAKQRTDTLELARSMADKVNMEIDVPVQSDQVRVELNSESVGIEPTMLRACCYASKVDEFLNMPKKEWKREMRSAFKEETDLPLSQSQVDAWDDCYEALHHELDNDYADFGIVFEYVLPYENGRRPDVVLVSEELVLILEFKRKQFVLTEDLDQTADYARDIREYHYESREKRVVPVLVLTRGNELYDFNKNVHICSSDRLHEKINDLVKEVGSLTPCEVEKWINSKYEPLPTMVEAARRFWNGEKLPNIKHVHAGTNLDEAIECLKSIAQSAENGKKNILAFVTGVPGAGKTFLGLQFVYDVCKSNYNQNSVFLSGNGPLVDVLQDALKNRTFVNDVNKMVRQYLDRGAADFRKNIVVFDEGQRAWDCARMTKSYKEKSKGRTEPDILIELCDHKLEWCVFLVLVGEGQEINTGENGGIAQWYDALVHSKKTWSVVCPNKLANVFEGVDLETYDDLDLKISIRSHTAGEVSNFVNAFVAGDMNTAKELFMKIPRNDFHMYYTRDLERAKQYCRTKYENHLDKRYGMIVSSKTRELARLGMPQPVWAGMAKLYPDGTGRRWKVAPWFNEVAKHPDSCCALRVAITEFDCQGLEIDMPIIGWGEDAKWYNGKWIFAGRDDEKVTYRNNSYRVLLTRGREGFIIYVPENRDDVAELLDMIGMEELKD